MAADRYIGMHSTIWPHPLEGPWVIRFHWGAVGDRVECIGLDVRSFRSKEEPAGPRPLPSGSYQPITTTLLRSLKADGLIQENIEAFGDLVEWASKLASTGAKARREATRVLESMNAPRRRGRPPEYPPEHYEKVATVYSEAHAANRTPRRAVAREFGVSETKAGHWIAKARKLGYLGETPGRGRAGGTVPPSVSIGQATETGTAQHVRRNTRIKVGQVTEADPAAPSKLTRKRKGKP